MHSALAGENAAAEIGSPSPSARVAAEVRKPLPGGGYSVHADVVGPARSLGVAAGGSPGLYLEALLAEETTDDGSADDRIELRNSAREAPATGRRSLQQFGRQGFASGALRAAFRVACWLGVLLARPV